MDKQNQDNIRMVHLGNKEINESSKTFSSQRDARSGAATSRAWIRDISFTIPSFTWLPPPSLPRPAPSSRTCCAAALACMISHCPVCSMAIILIAWQGWFPSVSHGEILTPTIKREMRLSDRVQVYDWSGEVN